MSKPTNEALVELNKRRIFVTDKRSFADNDIPHAMGVEIEFLLPKDFKIDLPDFGITTVSRREVAMHLSNFEIIERGDSRFYKFLAYMQLPANVAVHTDAVRRATSFIDLCYYVGNEAIPADLKPDAFTPVHDAAYADLGWYMPARVLDNLVDALARLNDTFFAGMLQDAIVYGPIVK